MKNAGIDHLPPIFANDLVESDSGLKAVFPHASRHCSSGVCKCTTAHRLCGERRVDLIGDGRTTFVSRRRPIMSSRRVGCVHSAPSEDCRIRRFKRFSDVAAVLSSVCENLPLPETPRRLTVAMRAENKRMHAVTSLTEQELLALEAKYCSYGETVHYSIQSRTSLGDAKAPGSIDLQGKPYLDMQMLYSAVNFGYRNQDIEAAHARQMATLPQVASQYLHKEKILLQPGLLRMTEKGSVNREGCISMSVAHKRSKTA
jgi:hypothetical protein